MRAGRPRSPGGASSKRLWPIGDKDSVSGFPNSEFSNMDAQDAQDNQDACSAGDVVELLE